MEVNIQIKSIFGKVLFEFSKENNTIKDTLIEAVKQGASLDGARLDGASLVGASLVGARLVGARLVGARLDGASLVGARLDGARLDGASLDGAIVNDILIVGPLGSRSAYTQVYRTDKGLFVKCGCFFGSIDDFANKVKETHGDNEHSKAYTRLIAYAKEHFEVKRNYAQ